MNESTEIIPIAIQEVRYNQQIANLVEHLLYLDQKMFEAHKANNPKGAA